VFKRVVRILGGLMVAATLVWASSPATAAAASSGAPAVASSSARAVSSVMLDPQPGPPYVYSGYRFSSESACRATGRAFLNGGSILGYTCRYVAGAWRLYVIPAITCGCLDVASLPSRLAALY
jgi:hypothetical protein